MEYTEYKNKVIKSGEEAFNAILNRKCKPFEIKNKTPLMIEYARHGENYFNLNENVVRFMVIGRAPGNFEEKTDCGVINHENMTVDKNIIEHCFDVHYNEEDPLSWIHRDDVKRGKRYIDSFPFFSFSKKVYLKLTDQKQDYEWYKNICYSNIFKIVSLIGGNPSDESMQIQEKYMAEILKTEISHYKPTHILILDSETDAHSKSSAGFKKEIKMYAEENGSKICFSNRPEFRKTIDLMAIVDRDYNLK